MRKVIPLIAGALLAGTVGLLRDGGLADESHSRTAPKRKRAAARARQRNRRKRTQGSKAKTAKGRAR
jgi:hypothetical protein